MGTIGGAKCEVDIPDLREMFAKVIAFQLEQRTDRNVIPQAVSFQKDLRTVRIGPHDGDVVGKPVAWFRPAIFWNDGDELTGRGCGPLDIRLGSRPDVFDELLAEETILVGKWNTQVHKRQYCEHDQERDDS